MGAMILNGRKLSDNLKLEFQKQTAELQTTYGRAPGLAMVLVGDHPASKIYVKNKIISCEKAGIVSLKIELPENTTESELETKLKELNRMDTMDGILLQLPLPSHLSETKMLQLIAPEKDVDCLGFVNQGKMFSGVGVVTPCTPQGIVSLLKENKIDLLGKECVVVGRSDIVGKPMAQLLVAENATVTICHSKTKDLNAHLSRADIVVLAAGKQALVKSSQLKKSAVVIDVGIHRTDQGLTGDVEYDQVEHLTAYSPVPGGVGPMTIAMLLKNCIELFKARMTLKLS
ncbi:MAG: bifunctional 5,10-methylenetetrahydrofolate dehydrogenase/5,10-methenyltetrahydrofolate cyclohydrolase [Bdellovibrionales bacterium]